MKFGSKICRYREEILKDLSRLIAIPSVRGETKEGMPYGEKSTEALNCILSIAEEMGFETQNIGNYAGHAEYGTGNSYAAVLSHIDVVPAGDGWATDPFQMVIKDGLVYGRGTADDKGPTVVALYCLKALKDEGVLGNRKLRVIFGAGEETGMNDLEVYFKSEPLPEMGFTPDSDYGICNREKGILHFDLIGKEKYSIVKSFHAGVAVNAVPDKAVAELVCTEQQVEALKKSADQSQGKFTFEKTSNGVVVTSIGTAAHACKPELGFNAVSYLIKLLCSVIDKSALGNFISFLQDVIGTEIDGSSFGVKLSDGQSGPLTMNLGLLQINEEKSCAGVDIRYPVTADGEEIIKVLTEKTENAGFAINFWTHNPPLYLPEDSELITLLKQSFQEITGKEAGLYATGGGTYARSINGRGVAFGPFFEDEPDRRLHNSNENIDLERFMIHAQICLEAMYRMMIV